MPHLRCLVKVLFQIACGGEQFSFYTFCWQVKSMAKHVLYDNIIEFIADC